MRLLLLLSLLLGALALTGSTASAAVPGRVTFSVSGGAVERSVDGGRVGGAVALPNGDVVLAGGGLAPTFYAAELTSSGSLDPSFGMGGFERLPFRLKVMQVLRQSDGKLLVLGSGEALSTLRTPQLEVVRLNAGGSLDQTYGEGGVAVTGLDVGCTCSNAVLTPDDSLLVVGDTGEASPVVEHAGSWRWNVEQLTSTGAPDLSFGKAGIATVPLEDASGIAIARLPDGEILTDGKGEANRGTTYLTALTPSGSPDVSYGGGVPVKTPAAAPFSMLASPDGSVTLTEYPRSTLTRYTPTGALDTHFGEEGYVRVSGGGSFEARLLPGPGEDVLYVSPSQPAQLDDPPAVNVLRVEPITPAGTIDPVPGIATLTLPFGGGVSGQLTGDSFDGTLLQRSDGSFLAVGTVGIAELTGEGSGSSVWDFAAAAFTSSFAPDPTFGTKPPPLRVGSRLPAQRTDADLRGGAISVAVDASSPGLARVIVRAGRQVLAQRVKAILRTGWHPQRIELTAAGRRALRGSAHLRVTITVTARDLWTQTGTSTVRARLR